MEKVTSAEYKCTKCGAINNAPQKWEKGTQYVCHSCNSELEPLKQGSGETSAAVGLIGGAALGASIGGPAGAIIGGVVGAVLGKNAKGLG